MSNELDLLAAARPPGRGTTDDVYPSVERLQLLERITSLSPEDADETDADASHGLLDLVHPPRPPRRRPMLIAVTAAAVVAVVAAAAALLQTGSAQRPGGGTEVPSPSRSLPFAVKPSSGFVVVGTSMVARRGLTYYVEVYRPHDRTYVNIAHSHRVTVAGHRAYYGCVTSDPPRNWRNCPNGPLAWHYRPNAWVLVTANGNKGSLPDLLRVARALTFDKRTPLRSPISLARAPEGTHLVSCAVVYPTRNATLRARLGPWMVHAAYAEENGNWIELSVFPFAIKPRKNADRREVTVNGHPGYWYPNIQTLDLQIAVDVQLIVVESNDQDGSTLTQQAALTIAANITLAAHPTRRATWFPLAGALP
jgi:hypothetical protein